MERVGISIKALMFSCFCILFLSFGINAKAADFTVQDVVAVLETTGNVGIFTTPNEFTLPTLTLSGGIPVSVTGITSNGWFRVDIGGVFYMRGNALGNPGCFNQSPSYTGLPDASNMNIDTSGIPSNMQANIPISYVPPVRVSSLDKNLTDRSEIDGILLETYACHADTLNINSRISAYSAIWNAASNFLLNKGLYNYEEATISGVTLSSKGKNYKLSLTHLSTIAEEEYVDREVVNLAASMNSGSDYDKILNVHDWICRNVSYSYDTAYGKRGYDYRSAYDALYSKTSVCSGYALLFQKFMDVYNIPCYICTGNNHAWNIVNIGGVWYHIDCTNDDQSFGIVRNYFLVGAPQAGYNSWGGITISPYSYQG